MNHDDVVLYLSIGAFIGIPVLAVWLKLMFGKSPHCNLTTPAEHQCECAEFKRKYSSN